MQWAPPYLHSALAGWAPAVKMVMAPASSSAVSMQAREIERIFLEFIESPLCLQKG
jgi:hypothetical protein